MDKDEVAVLRVRDFWTSLVLIATSIFFLFQTSEIPFFDARSAGVDSAQWYNSAALVPYLIFSSLLVLSCGLLVVAVRDGAAQRALTAVGIGADGQGIARIGAIVVILAAYIFGLVPRVDFVIGSALLVTALIWGFHRGVRPATWIATLAVLVPALYALLAHFPSSEWSKPHDDDWIALASFAGLTVTMFVMEARAGSIDRVVRITPVVAIVFPLILVCAMAFGFRQNVPNRGGLIFSQLEYQYYVVLKPLWQSDR